MLSRRVVGRLSPLVRSSLRSLRSASPVPVRAYALARGPSSNDPFANGTNAYYADEMYRLWKQDPKSVHSSWDVYFSGLDKGLPSYQAFQPPPTTLPPPADGAPALHVGGGAELDDHLKVRNRTLARTRSTQLLENAYLVMLNPGPTSRSCVSSARSPYG